VVTHEERRLEASPQRTSHWKRWGPYLSGRAWGSVREDGSPYGTAWYYLRAARWPGCAWRLVVSARVTVCPRGEARRQGLVVALTP
jgi:hypothetical protein